MATKRKSDAMESAVLDVLDSNTPAASSAKYIPLEPAPKKPRVSAEASGSGAKGMAKSSDTPQTWKDIKLEGEDEVSLTLPDPVSEFDASFSHLGMCSCLVRVFFPSLFMMRV